MLHALLRAKRIDKYRSSYHEYDLKCIICLEGETNVENYVCSSCLFDTCIQL